MKISENSGDPFFRFQILFYKKVKNMYNNNTWFYWALYIYMAACMYVANFDDHRFCIDRLSGNNAFEALCFSAQDLVFFFLCGGLTM